MNEEQGKFLEELYHANFKRMLLELYPILKDMPSAQVAIQEAARIACQKPEEMMSSPNPAGWLRKTAGLVAKNMLREQARQKRTFLGVSKRRVKESQRVKRAQLPPDEGNDSALSALRNDCKP